jgi:hypothetical protein
MSASRSCRISLPFVDGDRHLGHHQFGEGAYENRSGYFANCSRETTYRRSAAESLTLQASRPPLDWGNPQSAEKYLGYARTVHFTPPDGAEVGRTLAYTTPLRLQLSPVIGHCAGPGRSRKRPPL